ncbi:hypothetical protein F6S08_17690 [Pseudomonas sp. JV449]|nr:hypothetical protein [Pseudomonas sp. JV449]
MGQGWPIAAAHAPKPSFGHTEPRRGAECWGEAFLVTFGALPKVTRCKSGTIGRRYLNNGYVPNPPPKKIPHQNHQQFLIAIKQFPPPTSLSFPGQAMRKRPCQRPSPRAWPGISTSEEACSSS